MKDQLAAYQEFVRPYYATRDIAHNFEHIERILGRLPVLSAGMLPPPRLDHLYFLACFHGLGKRLHREPELQDQAGAFLRRLGWTETQIPELFASLDRHITTPQSVEEAIVHDANLIEILGAFGIAKAFTMGGVLGQTYAETADYYEHKTLAQAEFYTPAGRHLFAENRPYALAFLARLRQELENRNLGGPQ